MNDTIDDPDGVATPGLAHLRMPVDVRSTSLGVLAVLACVLALHLAGSVIVPLLLALMASYALNPVVDRLERLGLQRVLGATLLLMSIVAGTSWAVYSLSDDATALVESLPGAAEKVRQAVRSQRGASESALDKVQRARRNSNRLRRTEAQRLSCRPVVSPG